MKKILLILFLCSVYDVNASASTQKFDIDTPIDINLSSLRAASQDSASRSGLQISSADFDGFISKLSQRYWNKTRNVFNISVFTLYKECVSLLKNSVNKSSQEKLDEFCSALSIGSVKHQQSALKAGKQTSNSDKKIQKKYEYIVDPSRPMQINNLDNKASRQIVNEYVLEMQRKYCPGGDFAYQSEPDKVFCNGKDILSTASVEKKSDLLFMLHARPRVIKKEALPPMTPTKQKYILTVEYKM